MPDSHLSEAEIERIVDRRVMARLATDRAFKNAANQDDAANREQEIEDEEYEAVIEIANRAEMNARTIREDG